MVKHNVHCLVEALRNRPRPTGPNQTLQVPVNNRVDQLNDIFASPYDQADVAKDATIQVLHLTSVEYAHGHETWYEWEVDLG